MKKDPSKIPNVEANRNSEKIIDRFYTVLTILRYTLYSKMPDKDVLENYLEMLPRDDKILTKVMG